MSGFRSDMSGLRSDMSCLYRICPVWGSDMSGQTESRAVEK
jgi:hypothetical protein